MPRRPLASRRQFLATLGVAAAGGCLGDGENPSTPATPTSTVTDAGESTLLGYDVSVPHDASDWDRYDESWSAPTDSPLSTGLSTETLIENMEIAWDLSFAADGSLFVTERVGRVLHFEDGEVTTIAEPADAIDAGTGEESWWVDGGEGGTLGVAAHPTYPDPPLLYVYYTYRSVGQYVNKVEAFDVSADDPNGSRTTLVDGIPGDIAHNGGRIAFGPENYLWIATGDGDPERAEVAQRAQDPSTLGGKVLRVTPAGEPAPGNPAPGGDADTRVFTYGHRNPQCITFLPDATPIEAEHGPGGRDEVNRLVAGGNYGWPDVRRPDEYANASDVRGPLVNSRNSTWAPSGGTFYTGDAVPSLQNRLIVGCLRSQQLLFVTITPAGEDLPPDEDGVRFDQAWTDDGYVATVHTTFEDRLGRIRHVEQGPDGGLYAITSNWDGRATDGFPRENDDVLVRITPS